MLTICKMEFVWKNDHEEASALTSTLSIHKGEGRGEA